MKLEQIEQLCANATPGPWDFCYDGSGDYSIGDAKDPQDRRVANVYEWDRNSDQAVEDCRLIAASRELIPKLLAVARAAAGICVGDGIVECPEGGPSFYKVENRFAENVRSALAALEQE